MRSFSCLAAACLLASVSLAQSPTGPILESAQMPKYPVIARTAHVIGDLEAEFTLDETGSVTSVQILSGPPLLARATEENIKTWKFYLPADNKKSPSAYKTKFSYRLSNKYVSEDEVPALTVKFDSFKRVEITSDQWDIKTSD